MPYTKHFVIHTFDKLNNADQYVKDAVKTTVTEEHADLDLLFKYTFNPDKTMNKQLVSGHLIGDTDDAYHEMSFSILMNEKMHGHIGTVFDDEGNIRPLELKDIEKGDRRGKPVLAHHVIQSFSPEDKLTYDQIHEIGRQTALELTNGEHQFTIATHVNKDHIHNHIIFNATNEKTGKKFRWQKQTKRELEQISDKISSRYGAKIIEKGMRNSHEKYTLYQTQSLFKNKIKSRLDYLMENSASLNDFMLKAEALDLKVDFSKKHATFKLLDEGQQQNTRARALDKKHPEKYSYESIKEKVENNDIRVSVEEVKENYIEQVEAIKQDFDQQVIIEPWQVDSTNDKGMYVNVDFGSDNHGQVFIYSNKIDELEEGNYALFIKDKDTFFFTNDDNKNFNRYMTGQQLARQLARYNGRTPIRKEPQLKTIDDTVKALTFYVEHGDGTLLSGQGYAIEQHLINALVESKQRLKELDDSIIELKQELAKNDEFTENDLNELQSIQESRDLLNDRYKQALNELDYARGIESTVNKSEK